MDYKKKYEEVLERGTRLWKSGTITLEDYEYMFPEIKESEDEKIRKSIIRLIQRGGYMSPEDKDKAYAWLENQGMQKPIDKVEPKFKAGDTIVEKDIDEYDYETIKDIKDGQYIFADGYCMNIDEQDGWQLVKTPTIIKQNPTWSEEDKICEKSLEYSIVEKDMTEYAKGFECGIQRVLKYPEDFNLCEKSASVWSEDDERMFSGLNSIVEDWYNTMSEREKKYYGDFGYIDWLKSIKERMKGE